MISKKRWFGVVLVAATLSGAGSLPVYGAITTYTDRAAFLASLAPGYYEEPDMAGVYESYSGGSFSYEANASDSPFPGPVSTDLSTQIPGGPITFLNFSPGIKAFGGYFYNANNDNNVVSSPIQIQLNDGTPFTYTTPGDGPNPGSATSFYGFISDSNLISASVTAITSPVSCTAVTCLYPTVGSVIVGTTGAGSTPAPAPAPLLGAAAAFGASRRLRRRLMVRQSGG
jgi:hypothetical protein